MIGEGRLGDVIEVEGLGVMWVWSEVGVKCDRVA